MSSVTRFFATYGVKENPYAGMVQNQVTPDDLFG